MRRKLKNRVISGVLVCTMCAYTLPVFAYTKDETVYSKVDNQGKNYQTIVSTRLKNEEGLETLEDITDLLKIENTNGEEEFTQEGNSLIWKADKKDIYYQGESKKDLPIECEIQYQLDGKTIKPEDIAGKTGHVKITINYKNKDEHMVTINGKEEKMYTPFVVVSGLILKNDANKNIEITNGKVIDDGSKSLVMGMAMPGLQESLQIEKEAINLPDSMEIQMDATDFEMGNIITFVTPKVLEEKDLTFLDKLEEMYSRVNTLEEASYQIKEGGEALAKGTNALASGTKELKTGTNNAFDGAKQIKDEVKKATNQLENSKSEALDENTLNAIGEQAKQVAKLTDTQKTQIGKQAQTIAIQAIQSKKGEIGKQAEEQVKNLTLTRYTKTTNQGKYRSTIKSK